MLEPNVLAAALFETRGIIGSVVIGLVIGVIAKLLMPGKDPGGCIITILIGLAGSFIGTFLGSLLWRDYRAGWIASILGAMLLLFIYRRFAARRP
jgi:uncharacterized membrane protein YeaQ/YmgE (transglycosylase-associated protein family)